MCVGGWVEVCVCVCVSVCVCVCVCLCVCVFLLCRCANLGQYAVPVDIKHIKVLHRPQTELLPGKGATSVRIKNAKACVVFLLRDGPVSVSIQHFIRKAQHRFMQALERMIWCGLQHQTVKTSKSCIHDVVLKPQNELIRRDLNRFAEDR